MRLTLSLSQVPEYEIDFEMREPFSPETDDFGMEVPLSPEPQGFSTRAPLSHGGRVGSKRGDAVRAVSPLPHAEDFGVPAVPEEGPSQIGPQQPADSEASEPFGSSSKARREYHIASSYMYLTLVHAGWIWGEPAPSPRNSKQKGKPGMIGEVERTHESVC